MPSDQDKPNADQRPQRRKRRRFREIDLALVAMAIELSRKSGIYVFLPLSLVSALVALITGVSLLDGADGASWIDIYWFLSSVVVFAITTTLFVQRGKARWWIMIPLGTIVSAIGLALLLGWALSFKEAVRTQKIFLASMGWIMGAGPAGFGISLCRYGAYLFRSRI